MTNTVVGARGPERVLVADMARLGLILGPILVLIGRPQDAWLATWSRAESTVSHPIDPILLADSVVALLRSRADGGLEHTGR